MTDGATPPAEFVTEHHERLARWLADGDERALQAFLDAHRADFTLVSTEGRVVGLTELARLLAGAGGSAPGLRIEVTDAVRLDTPGELVVLRFVETHRGAGPAGRRIVTAVLDGRRWVAVHETAVRS